jgi:hypothetical protein
MSGGGRTACGRLTAYSELYDLRFAHQPAVITPSPRARFRSWRFWRRPLLGRLLMLRLLDDHDDVTGPFLPEATAIALTTALLQHRAALVALASSVCDFARELYAKDATREEVVVAVRKLVAESRTLTGSVLEEDGDDEVLDAMVDSCLDEFASNQ